jgi:aryl-alcohol dehydrogenase-like predicted oxidoreductase
MEKRGNRDEIVLATKFTMGHRNNEPIPINFGGNSTKSLHVSVNASLKKLRTDYIDLVCIPHQIRWLRGYDQSVLTFLAVSTLVGFHYIDPRNHAVSQQSDSCWQSLVSRYQ